MEEVTIKEVQNEEELSPVIGDTNYIELPKPLVYKIVQLFVTGQYTYQEIGHILKCHPVTVSKWLRHPDVREMVSRYQQEETALVDQAIKTARLKAVGKMVELLDAENEMVQWQAARDILDRTGHKAESKKTVNVNVRTFEEQLTDLIDGEYEEVD